MADSNLQNAIARDAGFIGRLSSLMSQIAKQKLDATPSDAYAKKVLNGAFTAAQSAVYYLLQTDNFIGQAITIVPLGSGFAVLMADLTDAAALSEISTVWTTLASLFG